MNAPENIDECPDGWRPIYEALVRELAAWSDETGTTVCMSQVKEKHGELRVYLWPPEIRPTLEHLVENAHAAVLVACQWCGDPGRHGHAGSTAMTVCPSCAPADWSPTSTDTT